MLRETIDIATDTPKGIDMTNVASTFPDDMRDTVKGPNAAKQKPNITEQMMESLTATLTLAFNGREGFERGTQLCNHWFRGVTDKSVKDRILSISA
jgi:hypothetical protein